MKYTYTLHPVEKPKNASYTREELLQMTTIQLREILRGEKIIYDNSRRMDRNYMIDMILKFRGAKLYTHIQDYDAEGLERVLKGLKGSLHFTDGEKKLQIPARMVLYKKADVSVMDGYTVQGSPIDEGNGFLLDEDQNIRGIFHVCCENGVYFLVFPWYLLDDSLATGSYFHFSLGFLDEKTSRNLCRYYYGAGPKLPTIRVLTCPLPDLEVMPLQETKSVLVMDFGSSNTAAGALKENAFFTTGVVESIQKVNFLNTLQQAPEKTELIPTVVSVQNCREPENISYRFGYDAMDNARKHSYTNSQSVFYGLKKWVNSYNQIETIVDEQGNTAQVARKEILKAYFEHIIGIAQQQFKCIFTTLHITSPVKQKRQYLQMYKDVLTQYHIVWAEALDEGVAVLYNTISKQIAAKSFQEGVRYQGLIIDCGGGTTDLTSCSYEIGDSRITYTLNLDTTYANGLTHFGGNNITFRIMQYLKILFSYAYSRQPVPRLEDLLETGSFQVYRFLDEYGRQALYEHIDRLYTACEDMIPTQYEQYKKNMWEEYRQVRSNFYFLWHLAEKIKLDFYQGTAIVQTDFHQKGIQKDRRDKKIIPEESWRINVYENCKEGRQLVLHTEYPSVVITKEEINLLIQGDIYYVVKQFMEPVLENESLNHYHFIKLTGQTCRIPLFREALKEFIPGRLIETAKKEKTVQDFKLSCLEGAIQYQNAKHIGLIAPTIINKAPVTPYSLTAHTHRGEEMVLMSSLDEITKTYGFVSRNIDTRTIELFLQDAQQKNLYTYHVNMDAGQFKDTTYEEMENRYGRQIYQDDIDNIVDGEVKIFTFANEDRWGFFVLPLARKEKALLMGEELYFPFETGDWDNNFFDGRK